MDFAKAQPTYGPSCDMSATPPHQPVPPTPENIGRAAEILRQGGLVGLPTETVYGLAANALDEQAVARVFEVKGRPKFDPLIVHVADQTAVDALVTNFPEAAERLASRFWPGPLTLVLPKSAAVPDLVTAGSPSIAIRIPRHPVALAVLQEAGVPVAAPSANPFGRISPTTAEHVHEQLGGKLDLILDGGPCVVGVESTVLLLQESEAVLLRPGGISLEQLERELGTVRVATAADHQAATPLLSPGRLPQHYAPRTPLVLAEMVESPASRFAAEGARVGLLAFTTPLLATGYAEVEVLAPTGELRDAAAGFFAGLRRLDALGLDLIVAQVFPEIGLGRALNDRLRRAASRG